MEQSKYFSFIPVSINEAGAINWTEAMCNPPYEMPLDRVNTPEDFWNAVDTDCRSIKKMAFIIPYWPEMQSYSIPDCMQYHLIPYRNIPAIEHLLLFIKEEAVRGISHKHLRECYDQYIERLYETGELCCGEKVDPNGKDVYTYAEFCDTIEEISYIQDLESLPSVIAIYLHELGDISLDDLSTFDSILGDCNISPYFNLDKGSDKCMESIQNSGLMIFEAYGRYFNIPR